MTRIYGARGADVFAEGMLSIHGDLIKIEGSRDLEMTGRSAGRATTPPVVEGIASGIGIASQPAMRFRPEQPVRR